MVHRQVHQCEYGSNFTRSCTTPGVRAPSNACTVGRSAPLQLLEPPQSDTRATTGTTCGCELETKETTQTGIITVIRRMEAKVKRNCDNLCVWGESVNGAATASCRDMMPGGSGSNSMAGIAHVHKATHCPALRLQNFLWTNLKLL